jgi:hypothetical protein
VHPDRQVLKARQVSRGLRDRLVPQVPQVPQVPLDRLDLLVPQEPRV